MIRLVSWELWGQAWGLSAAQLLQQPDWLLTPSAPSAFRLLRQQPSLGQQVPAAVEPAGSLVAVTWAAALSQDIPSPV